MNRETENWLASAQNESVEALAKTPEEVANRHPASFLADILKDAVVVYDRDLAHA